MHINEGWDIITSVYFTFVTTLTIGFGDDQANFLWYAWRKCY